MTRYFLPLLLAAVLGDSTTTQAQTTSSKSAQITAATLDSSEVRITYGELKRLVAAAEKPPAPQPEKKATPVPAALLSCQCKLDVAVGKLLAELQVENFDGEWHAVPVAGLSAGVMSVEPASARVVVHEGRLCVITDKAGAQSLKLTYALSPEGQTTTLELVPAPVAAVEVVSLPEGKAVRLQNGGMSRLLTVKGPSGLPASGGEMTLTVESAGGAAAQAVLAAASTDDAILTGANYTTQVVRDGTVLTEGSLTVRHDLPARLALQLPEGARLLQCHVNGEVLRMAAGESGRMEIPLDEPSEDESESEVKVSFTQVLAGLLPTEGELVLALPQTPFFAREIDWLVQMPAGFDLGASGNVEVVTEAPAAPDAPRGLRLRKPLCRDQQPQARITYRKRATSN